MELDKATQAQFEWVKRHHAEAANMRLGHGRGDNHCLRCWKDEGWLIELVEKLLKEDG